MTLEEAAVVLEEARSFYTQILPEGLVRVGSKRSPTGLLIDNEVFLDEDEAIAEALGILENDAAESEHDCHNVDDMSAYYLRAHEEGPTPSMIAGMIKQLPGIESLSGEIIIILTDLMNEEEE